MPRIVPDSGSGGGGGGGGGVTPAAPLGGGFTIGTIEVLPGTNMSIDLAREQGRATLNADNDTKAMGEISAYNNSTATVISTSATWTKIEIPTTLGANTNFDMPADGRLRYIGTKTAMVHAGCTVSASSAGASDVVLMCLFYNGEVNGSGEFTTGTALTAGAIRRKMGAGGDIGSSAIHVIVEMATNDYLELAMQNLTDTDDLTITDLNIFALMMP